jgi:hypothetical protein
VKRHLNSQVGQLSDLPVTRNDGGITHVVNFPNRAPVGQVKDLPYLVSAFTLCS